MRARTLVIGLLGSALAVIACEAIFDDPIQCHADADCARFGVQARCDVIQGVCVSRTGAADDASVNPQPGNDAGGIPPDSGFVDVPPPPPDCLVANKPTVNIPAAAFTPGTLPTGATATSEITADTTLNCDKNWLIQGNIYVRTGVTLTIAAGTTIFGDKTSNGGLYIQPGAKIVANGRADAPIVFTSSQAAGTRVAGDWRGLILMGKAPPTIANPLVVGDPLTTYSGADAADISGSLRFVRIEYAALGIRLGGIGTGTSIDSVQVRKSTDDCFGVSGGTVNMSHLICQAPGDEAYQIDNGYDGRLQFLVAQRTPAGPNHNGMNVNGSFVRAYNATFCGTTAANQGLGLQTRNGARLDLGNAIVTRYSSGFDLVGALGAPFDIRASRFKNQIDDYAYTETDADTDAASPTFDDDNGFDEIAFLEAGAGNGGADILPGCDNQDAPVLAPTTAVTGGARTPPTGFDQTATFIGAAKDANDKWATAAWVVWSAQ